MSVVEDLSDALARDALEAEQRLGDNKIAAQISEILGATSSTAQEAFLTAVRVRRAEARAREFLEECEREAAKKGGVAR